MEAHLADLGGVALPGSPAEFGKLIADETEKRAKVIKFAGWGVSLTVGPNYNLPIMAQRGVRS
jgi:hypothetical protein